MVRHALLCVAFLGLSAFRPDDPASVGLFRFEPGFEVEHHDGPAGLVRVHFTRAGPDAVALGDANENGVPDTVEQVAAVYEEVFAFFLSRGFRSPVSDLGSPAGDGGSDALDVYLIDFGGQADGAFVRDACLAGRPICSGYIAQENDFSGYGYPSFRAASRILASHELFHAVQAAYDAEIGANWGEATATWASERFDPSLNDFEHLIRGWFERPDRTLDQEPIGPVDGFSYGLAIFAQYLSERFGDDVIRRHWEDLEDGAHGEVDPRWLPALGALLEREHASTFADALLQFAEWVIRTGQGPTTGSFAQAAAYPRVARQVVTLPFADERLRVYRASLQVWGAAPGGLQTVAAALADPDLAVLDGVELILATRKGGAVTSILAELARDGVLVAELPVDGADEVVAVVVNTTREGQSRRPGLCLGALGDVERCVGAKVPVEPEPETPEPGPEVVESGPDAVESGPDAVESDSDLGGPAPKRDSGGCAGGAAAWWTLGLVLVARARTSVRV